MNSLDFKQLRHSAQDLTPQHRHIFDLCRRSSMYPSERQPGSRTDRPCLLLNPLCFQLSTRDQIQTGTGSGIPALPMRSLPRKFTPLINTPLAETGEVGGQYLPAMEECLSVRKAADQVGMNSPTAFLWRHRFLDSPSMRIRRSFEGSWSRMKAFVHRSRKGEGWIFQPGSGEPECPHWHGSRTPGFRAGGPDPSNRVCFPLDKDAVLCHAGPPLHFTLARGETGIPPGRSCG